MTDLATSGERINEAQSHASRETMTDSERPTDPQKRFQNETTYSNHHVDTTAYTYYERRPSHSPE